MTIPVIDLLDGTAGVRTSTVRWDVTSADGSPLGQLMLDKGSPPTITNDASRPVRRTVGGLVIPARPDVDVNTMHLYADDVDPLTMRVLPVWVIEGGTTDYEYPLGKFLWVDDSEHVHSYGQPRDGELHDLCLTLDQDLDENVGYPPGTVVSDALTAQALAAGIAADDMSIEATTIALAEPTGWAAGSDTRLTVLEGLCQVAGYLPPYFDNDGILVCRSAPDLASATVDFNYGTQSVYRLPIVLESIVRSGAPLDAPNRYVAVDTGAVDVDLVGVFDVPDDAPFSFANRGFRIVRTVNVQGLADQASADAAAAAAYANEPAPGAWISFSTPPDPRHDTFDVISFDGVRYLQRSWSLTCVDGTAMDHEAASTYA